jgi:ribose 5-phosphate isomerase A
VGRISKDEFFLAIPRLGLRGKRRDGRRRALLADEAELSSSGDRDDAAAKRAAAAAALGEVEPGMKLGLGTGSTAAAFVDLLGPRVRAGLDVVGVPTSLATAAQASGHGIRLAALDDIAPLDLTIDGADEIGPGLALIKGGGGALLREKIVARASRRMIVIADRSKQAELFGAFPLPVEIVRFAPATTMGWIAEALEGVGITASLRLRADASGRHFTTDEGNLIVDCACGRIDRPAATAAALSAVIGVVEHGLFVGMATEAIIGDGDGSVRRLGRGPASSE